VNGPDDPSLEICVLRVAGGKISPHLSAVEPGSDLPFTGPYGHFTFRPSRAHPLFIATGTGIAPFVSMVRAGASGFTLLHGVRASGDLYYEASFRDAAAKVVPCLTAPEPGEIPRPDLFIGDVRAYLETELPRGRYDFYLCGRGEMTRDVTLLVDERFQGSRVYTEIFFSGHNQEESME